MSTRVSIIPHGALIQECRIKAGMSTIELAEAASIKNSAVIRIEKSGGVRAKTAAGICDALGMEFDQLFTIKRPSDSATEGR